MLSKRASAQSKHPENVKAAKQCKGILTGCS